LYEGIVVLSVNMILDKRQELERLRAAILQEQDTDILVKLLEELNEAVSYSKRGSAVIIASRQRGASVLKYKESQGLPKAVAKNFD
jgi:23S rRNA maturation mini-RNase III